MTIKIREALAKLNVEDDSHWTSDGLPVIEVMKELVGEPVSRADITFAAKGFSRKTPVLGDAEKDPATTEPNETQSPGSQNSELNIVETGEIPDDPQEALDLARKNLAESQKQYEEALKLTDAMVVKEEEERQGFTQAHAVQAFQKAQQAQRAEMAERRKAMVLAINATKTEY